MSTGLCKATNSFVCKYRSDACMSQDGSRSKQFFAVQIRSGDRTLKDWFGGSLEEETQLVDLFAEYASGKKDIRLFCGIEVIFIDRNRFCCRHS